MDDLLPLLVAVPLLGAALLVAGGRRLHRVAAESMGCAVSAGTAALALVLLLNSSPPYVEWVGGWTPWTAAASASSWSATVQGSAWPRSPRC